MDRLIKDNGGVVIMHDLSFLIRGMRIMEIGHFSFYTSFLGRLYHLLTRQGDFNSGPWLKCRGMGRISLWAELLYWGGGGGGGPNSLHKAEVWACALGFAPGPMYMSFSTPLVAPLPLTKVGLGKG